jgi:hypothetical protein
MHHSAHRLIAGLVVVAIGLGACGGGGADASSLASARPAQDTIVVNFDDASPFELQSGRYRFSWDASGCAAVDFQMTGAGTGFRYQKASAIAKFTAIVSNVPADTFTLVQADPTCAEWLVVFDRIGS